ncbi:hypothetical protein Pcinc_029587 [Petrolisthes cinctipes]|uniref:GDNF/GAS1 domain-containing protein n=1 Tax=Petrolisthes cinctipes TaxID=88211 RepID=A0AAE1F0J4_PETCI|nr:hypothetical protein Pcinc_029587 [Petrolisthes cinctipes]
MVQGHCLSFCHQDACRHSLQDLYKYLQEQRIELATMIAFCVCRAGSKDADDESECEAAQRRLHPPCATRTEGLTVSQCHHLGNDCRNDRICRYRLEQYETRCAADLLTGVCAGGHDYCRRGVVGLMGSRLHTRCHCQVEGVTEVNQCLAWKRLLWGNPCVVETQLAYHLERRREKEKVQKATKKQEEEKEKEEEEAEEEKRLEAEVGARAGFPPTREKGVKKKPRGRGGKLLAVAVLTRNAECMSDMYYVAGYCEITRAWEPQPRILEERESIRLYKDGDKDCTEMCYCERHHQAKCQVLDCVEKMPCETDFAVYNHQAPAFQHYRGDCICYAGDFICMRPKHHEYHLPMGLFLMVGYSRREEKLLRPKTNGGAIDAILPLQIMVSTLSSQMGEVCRLEVIQQTADNIVLQVRLHRMAGTPGQNYTRYMLREEVMNCEKPVREVAKMINTRDPRIHHHIRLSLFVLAEVINTMPNPQHFSGSPATTATSLWAWGVGVWVLNRMAVTPIHRTTKFWRCDHFRNIYSIVSQKYL